MRGKFSVRKRLFADFVFVGLLALITSCMPTRPAPQATPTLDPPCNAVSVPSATTGQFQIAFTAGTNQGMGVICIMNSDGSGLHTVTKNNRNNHMIAWSPDDRRISFESGTSQESNVYLVNVDGSNEIKLTHSNRALSGSWSPDGQRIVYTDSDPYRIHIVNVDGTNDTVIAPSNGNDRPRWSPDGQKLLFWSVASDNGVQIHTMNVDGNDLKQLTNQGFNVDPSWSPDGKQIVFVSNRDYVYPPAPIAGDGSALPPITGTPLQGVYQLYVMDADGSRIRQLTTMGDNFDPSWSPDGQQIAFDRHVGNQSQIFVMNVDGSNPVQLTFVGDNYGPVWSHS